MNKSEMQGKPDKKHPAPISILYVFLRLSVLLVTVEQLRSGNYENVFLCVITLILFFVPSLLEKKIHIDIPDMLETLILLFIFSAEILGEVRKYYIISPCWDTILHTINGFLAAAIGLSLIDVLNKHDRLAISLSPVFAALVAFCFSMTMGVVWELFEFGADQLFGADMQKDTLITTVRSILLNPEGANVPSTVDINSLIVNGDPWKGYIDIGLIDTMMDLLVNFIGAAVFSVFGYYYIKHRGRGRFLRRFLMKPDNKA